MEIIFPGPSVRTHDGSKVNTAKISFQKGRIAGQDGKTKFTIENTSRTRIILADTSVDIIPVSRIQNLTIFSPEKSTSLVLSKTSKLPATPSSR
jgi:hypothetical protein